MRDLLLLVIVIGLVPLILKRPWLGVLAWFWVGLMSPHSLTWGYMRTFPIAVVIGLATLAALVLNKDRRDLPYTREMVLMFIFAGFMAVTSAVGVNSSGAWQQWQHVMKVLLMTFVTPMLIFGHQRILWLLLVASMSIAFYGAKGGVFTILTGGGYSVLGPGNSFISGNTYLGLAMVMVLPMVLVSARLFSRQSIDLGWPLRKSWYKPLGLGLYGVFWLTGLAILATYSRGAWLGLLAVGPFVFWRMQRKWLVIAVAILMFGVIGVSAPERLTERWQTIENYEDDTSAMQRIQAWGVAWNMALERPFTGMGFRNSSMGYAWWISYANFEGTWTHVLSPHSIYFQVLGQHGFIGLGIFLTLIGFTYGTLGRISRVASRQPEKYWLSEYAWALRIGILGYLIAGAFLDVAYFNLLYAFIALAIIMRRELDEATNTVLPEGSFATAAQEPPVELSPELHRESTDARRFGDPVTGVRSTGVHS